MTYNLFKILKNSVDSAKEQTEKAGNSKTLFRGVETPFCCLFVLN